MSAVKTMTIAQVAERWIAHLEGEATPLLFDTDPHVDATLDIVDELIVPWLGSRPTDTITQHVARQWVIETLGRSREPITYRFHGNHILDVLQGMLGWAASEGIIPAQKDVSGVDKSGDLQGEGTVIA